MVETADGSGPELVVATMLARTISLEFSRLEVANVESWWLKAMTISLFYFFCAQHFFYWSILVNLFLGYFRYRALTHSLTDFIRGNPRVTNLSAIIHSRFCCWWSILVISFFFRFSLSADWADSDDGGSKEPVQKSRSTRTLNGFTTTVWLLLRETDRFPISQTRIPGLIFFCVYIDVDDVLVLVWICFCCIFLFANESKKIVRRVYVLGPNRKRVELDVVHDVLWSHDNM